MKIRAKFNELFHRQYVSLYTAFLIVVYNFFYGQKMDLADNRDLCEVQQSFS